MKEDGKLFWGQGMKAGGSNAGEACTVLRESEIIDCRMLPRGSNDVFLLSLRRGRQTIRAIYKPQRGEYPLWDFPDGTLYQRECAAYLVSEGLKWSLIPPTIIREGPFGVGAVQWFVPTNAVLDDALFEKHLSEFKRIAAFDWLTNNADRKVGHCLVGTDGRIWLIDHGLTFHEVPKLRTVIWHFAGQPVPEEILADLDLFSHRLTDESTLRATLSELLALTEVEALEERLSIILRNPVFPYSFGSRHRVPWPPY